MADAASYAASTARLSALSAGQVIAGRYELKELLGKGGMGAVYRAVQRPLGREVAIKMLLPEALAGDGALERFAREAALVQSLEHPNTVRLFDFGATEQGMPFMVFELLRGHTLEEEIAKGPFPPYRVGRVATQVLKALMEAHARGTIHRDIKPSNVLLLDYSGEQDFVKVLDFGVAKPTQVDASRQAITHAGQIIGTPSYMAPEQVSEAAIGPPTDLYALGLVMAEALTGRRVYDDDSPIAIWMKQSSKDPVPLSPAVTGSAFGAVIARATQKDPAQRYPTAAAMLADVERALLSCTAPSDAPAKAGISETAKMKPLERRGSAPDLGAAAAAGGAGKGWQAYGPTAPLTPNPVAATPPPLLTPQAMTPPALSPPVMTPAGTPSFPHSRMAYAPPISGVAPAREGSRMVLWIGLAIAAFVVVVVLVFVAGVGGAVLARKTRAPSPTPTPTLSPTSTTSPLDPSVPPTTATGKLRALSPARLDARLRQHGWNVTANSSMNTPGSFSGVFVTAQRGTTAAVVQLYDYENAQIAVSTEATLRASSTPGVVERDGGRILYVSVIQSPNDSRALFEDLVRP